MHYMLLKLTGFKHVDTLVDLSNLNYWNDEERSGSNTIHMSKNNNTLLVSNWNNSNEYNNMHLIGIKYNLVYRSYC